MNFLVPGKFQLGEQSWAKIQKYETSYWPALPHWLPRSPMVYAPLCDRRKGTFLFYLLSLLLVYCVSVWRDSFPFLLPLFKTEEMLFSVSHAASYVKKDKLFKVLEEPFKNHPRCEKLVIKAWWPKHVVLGKGSKSLTRDFLWFFYEKFGGNGYWRTSKLFKSIWKTLGTQQWANCTTICVGQMDSFRWFPEKYNIAEVPPAFAFAIGTVNCW